MWAAREASTSLLVGPAQAVAGSLLSSAMCRAVAARYGVGVASAVRWARQPGTGSVAARAMGRRRRLLLLGERAWFLARSLRSRT